MEIVNQNAKSPVKRVDRGTVYCSNLLDKGDKIQPDTFERKCYGMLNVYFHRWHLIWGLGMLGRILLPDMLLYLKQHAAESDVLYLNGYSNLIILAAARSGRGAGVLIITLRHSTLPIIVNSFLLKRVYGQILERTKPKGVGVIIALQGIDRQQALAHAFPADRIEITLNVIEPDVASHLPEPGGFRQIFGSDRACPLILYMPRSNRKSETNMLIEAFARRQELDAQLAVVGPDVGLMAEVRC